MSVVGKCLLTVGRVPPDRSLCWDRSPDRSLCWDRSPDRSLSHLQEEVGQETSPSKVSTDRVLSPSMTGTRVLMRGNYIIAQTSRITNRLPRGRVSISVGIPESCRAAWICARFGEKTTSIARFRPRPGATYVEQAQHWRRISACAALHTISTE